MCTRHSLVAEPVDGAEQDQIIQLFVAPLNAPLDLVVKNDAARARVLETDHPVRIIAQRFIAIAVVAVVARLQPLFHGLGAHSFDFFLGFIGVVRLAGLEQIFDNLLLPIHAQGLVERAFIVIKTEPAHAIQNRLHGLLSLSLIHI